MARYRSLALSSRGGQFVPLLLMLSAVLLYTGVTQPVMETRALIFWHNEFSIWDAVRDLWDHEDYQMAVAIGLFSIAFPTLKLVALGLLWTMPMTLSFRRGFLRRVQWLSHWAMLDVLGVAILIVMVRGGSFIDARPREGVFCFCGSIVATMILTVMISRAAGKRAH